MPVVIGVVRGDDLEILVPRAAVAVVVLDAGIRKSYVVLVVRQRVFPRPAGNLFRLTIRPAVAVLPAPVALVQEALIVALELVVQDNAAHPAALPAQPLLSALIGAIDRGVACRS